MNNYKIYYHSSEDMSEVADSSARLLVGASVYLEGGSWQNYLDLYHKVYVDNGKRILQSGGLLLILQTDPYHKNQVSPRNHLLCLHLLEQGYKLLDVKIWKRKKADMFQLPFTMVHLFGIDEKSRRPKPEQAKQWYQGIWEFPQVQGGKINAFPEELCTIIISALTQPDDLVVNAFVGLGRLPAIAEKLGRRVIGYEINKDMMSLIATTRREIQSRFMV